MGETGKKRKTKRNEGIWKKYMKEEDSEKCGN
jgi:hypothetical protein